MNGRIASPLRRSLGIALPYIALSIAWVLLGDRIANAAFPNPAVLSRIQSFKGIIFTLLSAIFVFVLLFRELRIQARTQASLRESVAARLDAECNMRRLNHALLGFGSDSPRNVGSLVAACGEIMGSDWAIYFRQVGGELSVSSQWNLPEDFDPATRPEVAACREMLGCEGEDVRVVQHPAQTDCDRPSNCPRTCAGHLVRYGSDCIGILCVGFTEETKPSEEALRFLGTISVAIGVEERRHGSELAERDQHRFASALADSAAALSGTLDFDEVLDRILANIGRVVAHDAASLMLVEGDALRVVRSAGYGEHTPPTPVNGIRLPVAEFPLIGRTLGALEPRVIPDTSLESEWMALPQTGWVRSHLVAPIRARGAGIGLLNLDSCESGFFRPEDGERLQAFADQAGIALENARLLLETQRRSQELTALYKLGLDLNAVLSPEALLQTIYERVQELIKCDGFGVTARDPQSGELVVLWAVEDGEPLTDAIGLRLPSGSDGLSGYVMRTRQSLLLSDMETDPLPAAPATVGRSVRSWLGIPLQAQGRLLGVLSVQSFAPHAFDAGDQRLLEMFAASVAVAMENSRLYEDARRHTIELEGKIQQRTTQLSAANERLKELDNLKSQFVSNVSHELRTPLANIRTHLYLLSRSKPEMAQGYLDTINREVDLLNKLIEDLLVLSGLDQHRSQVDLAPLDLNRLAETLSNDRRTLMRQRGLSLEVNRKAGLPAAVGDYRLVTQVLTNLMTNAMNYTPSGGRVIVETGERVGANGAAAVAVPVFGERDRQRSFATITVRDTGLGISPEDLPRVFDRFYRGDAARRHRTTGTGLGLAICAEIVEALEGHLSVESQPGVGSAFTVWLPTTRSL